MTGLMILLGALAVPYVGLNLRRLVRGRSWAFTFCQVTKEWEERERAKRLAARAAERAARQVVMAGGEAPKLTREGVPSSLGARRSN